MMDVRTLALRSHSPAACLLAGAGSRSQSTSCPTAAAFDRRRCPNGLRGTRLFLSLNEARPIPCGTTAPGSEVSTDKILHIVLFSPQIPGNTGCIARTCAASAVGLHLIEPLGFEIDSAKLKRAGLDYWPHVVVKIHKSWDEFRRHFDQQAGEKRLLAFTKRGTHIHSEFTYKRGDWLVFGSETTGLPSEVLLDCKNEEFGGGTIRIPMVETYVRCLNLSVSVGIALYEASRQLNYEHLHSASQTAPETQRLFPTEDIFA